MKKLFAVTAIALALGAGSFSPSMAQGRGQYGPMAGMMGGDCPTMGMMGAGPGRGMQGRGIRGQGMQGQGMQGQGMQGQGMMGRGMMGDPARMEAVVAGRLAYLRTELDVTAAQQDAWDEYADAVRGRIGVMQGVHGSMMETMEEGGAMERVDSRIQGMEAMLEAMKAVRPATAALYAVLTDEQKKLADELIGAGCGAM